MRRLAFCAVLVTAGCIQLPTEKQEVVDLRPQVSFTMADPGDHPGAYRVFVDGLDMGNAESYIAGRSALKVLSGTHLLKVERDGRTTFEERMYLGDGATRTVLLTKP
jgi:hypothetical protein